MPFASSATLDDKDSFDAQPGVTIGGGGRDASREQQILALREAKERDDAERTAARIAEERARRAEAARIAAEAAAKSARQEAARERVSTLTRNALMGIAVVVLGYLTLEALLQRPTTPTANDQQPSRERMRYFN
jgi:hypothetical protein